MAVFVDHYLECCFVNVHTVLCFDNVNRTETCLVYEKN